MPSYRPSEEEYHRPAKSPVHRRDEPSYNRLAKSPCPRRDQPSTKWEVIRELRENKGGFNTGIYLVRHGITGTKAIQKGLNPRDMADGHACWEVEALKQLRDHPHITNLLDVQGSQIYLEYCSYGDLDSLIERHKKRKRPFAEEFVFHILLGMAKALHHCHKGSDKHNPIVHRDIKPANILLRPAKHKNEGVIPQAVLADFGCALSWEQYKKNMHRAAPSRFTPGFAAPEVQRAREHQQASDVYQLGLVVLCMAHLSMKPPAHNHLPDSYGGTLKTVIHKMLRDDLERRLKPTEIVDIVEPKLERWHKRHGRGSKILEELDVSAGRE